MTDLNLRFLPWLRRGLARSVSAGAGDAYATLGVSFKIGGSSVSQSLRMRGPGDVIGIDPAQVLRVDPHSGTVDFEPNYFPCVEFVLPDLPWMFTPSAPDGDKLLPWLTLVTVSDGLGSITTGHPLPVLHAPLGELPPDLSEMWAWAHVQTTTLYASGSLTQALTDSPDSFISRIISPRNLQADTGYLACLVPTYKAGVLAGLGLPIAEDVGQALAWTADQTDDEIDLPVYYWWSFRTGATGDFELLVERLEPQELDDSVGRRDLDLSEIGIPLDASIPTTTNFYGALVSPTAIPDTLPSHTVDPLRQTIYDFLTAPPDPDPATYDYKVDDPVVTPAIYGREQLSGAPLPPPKADSARATAAYQPVWYDEVNTQPRTRGAAGLGMRIVRQHQEDFMARAWSTVTTLRSVNQTLQQATYASLIAGRWQGRVTQLGSSDLLGLTRSAHARVLPSASSQTIWGQIRAADVPDGSVSVDLQRATRSGAVVQHNFRLVSPVTTVPHVVRQTVVMNPISLSALTIHALPVGATTLDSSQPSSTAEPLTHGYSQTVIDLDSILPGKITVTERTTANNSILTAHQLASGQVAQFTALNQQGRALTPQMRAVQAAAINLAASTNQYINTVAAGGTPTKTQIQQIRDQTQTLQDLLQHGGLSFPAPQPPSDDTTLEPIAVSLSGALVPDQTISAHLQSRIQITSGSWGAQPIPSRFTGQPEFDEAVYPYVCDLSPEFMLPGIGELPVNTVGLVEVNGEFVEAALLGINQEMSREMLWREYPTDLSQTWFKHFWSAAQADIDAIDGWNAKQSLGEHIVGAASDDALVLLIKGDLLRRYPNLIVYAVQATVGGTPRTRSVKSPEVQIYPAFSGQLDTDVKFYGFDASQLTVASALGTATPDNHSSDGGYYFAFQQQPTEPRFGLDEYAEGGDYKPAHLNTWSDLSWGHFMIGDDPDTPVYVPISGHFRNKSLPDTTESDSADSTWGSSAGSMARIVLQRPVRMLVHASAMLPEGSS